MKNIVTLAVICLMVSIWIHDIASGISLSNSRKVLAHYPAIQRKTSALAACAATSNDQSANYGLTGWHMPASGMTYYINYSTKPDNLTNDQVYTALTTSANVWSSANPKVVLRYGGNTDVSYPSLDGASTISWRRLPNSALAVTYAWFSNTSGELIEADTVFNKRHNWSYSDFSGNDCGGALATLDIQGISTHEFGHWLGLADLYGPNDKDLTMYGYGAASELKKDSLGLGDILGAEFNLP